ncbi:hypothetical protein PHMEG_00014842 [Phytophthora megakarya]|uniref:Chromo domain-containing protein n=1 Tax=Phytophthora megakarya TaxID=4795 RepID=A0A225W5A2_9STRA|nr:hypothetical protein PHMEG_00014842 [Phytophthora megakarya]
MVQTFTRAIKMYIADIDQRDWDQYAERLTYALNTAHDRTRDETPFFSRARLGPAVHVGSDISRGELFASGPRGSSVEDAYSTPLPDSKRTIPETGPRGGGRESGTPKRERHGTRDRTGLTSLAVSGSSQAGIRAETRVYVARAVPRRRTETHGTPYQLLPIVHVSKLKPVRAFPSRPELRLTVPVNECIDFDEELLPEDSWEARDVGEGVYEVEKVLDVREGRKPRHGRTRREFHVKWLGYDETSLVDELDLNCGGLVYNFLRQRTGRSHFGVMPSHEDTPTGEGAGVGVESTGWSSTGRIEEPDTGTGWDLKKTSGGKPVG